MKVFKEEQRFTQTWIIVLTLFSVIVPIALLAKKYLNGYSNISPKSFIISIAILLAVSSLIFLFKLITRIDEKGIHYQFFPFHLSLKTIPWENIQKAEVKKYDAITDFGGWGLKGGLLWKTGKGKSITVSGDVGIQLLLKNNTKLLIGTLKEVQAKNVLITYINTLKND